MEVLFQTLGNKTYKNLLADPRGADLITVPVYPNAAALNAGALLYRDSTGLYKPIATGSVATDVDMVVLMEDLPINDTAVSTNATAARAGKFIDGAVTVTGATSLTAAQKLILRKQGIVFDPDTTVGTFENAYTVTYKANNGTTEPDYVVTEPAGATHTVLANTVTEFTAPSGKTFSKWNTKADGSGTDKAAAATISMTENVTLYAVWAS